MPTLSSRPRIAFLLLAGVLAGASLPAAAQDDAPRPARKAKQAVDDRADTGAILGNDVGKGTHLGAKATQPGTYLGDRSREAVHRYYAEHPPRCDGGCTAPAWQIGSLLPQGARVSDVPAPLLASLPKAPPGVRYVQVAGDVLLVAAGSRMVVDGIRAR
jgi:hypothetical protein